MRLLLVVFGLILMGVSAGAQTVAIRNVSFAGTALEVNNTVGVTISGAAPFGQVTLWANGQGPYDYGLTDEGGNWGITDTLLDVHVGHWEEHWYVDGVEMTPSNPSQTYLAFAPRLPGFDVYSRFTGTNCPGQSTESMSCSGFNGARHWVWSPVTYLSNSSLAFSSVTAAAGSWNAIQSKLSLSSDSSVRRDIWIRDDNTIPAYGLTQSFGPACGSQCYNRIDNCSGNCLNAASVNFVYVWLNIAEINNGAAAMNTTFATLAPLILKHEFGHALRLGHVFTSTGRCSELQSIMYSYAAGFLGCGVTAPNACDASGINSVYPTAVQFCPTYSSIWCYLANTCS